MRCFDGGNVFGALIAEAKYDVYAWQVWPLLLANGV